jgi:formate hydrogenlyase subunit 6/NADH:ubiquinone oxidoreductase subunit I
MCVRNCPSGAIQITKIGERAFEATIDLGKCVYCGQCADSCPKKTIELTGDFELASFDRETLRVVYHAKPKPATVSQEGPVPEPPSPKAAAV